jgi:hypothetical protein
VNGDADRFAAAARVADAVLYEGYLLYPYRASAQKNQMRWQFGVLTPPRFARENPGERSSMRSELVLVPRADAALSVRVRCLHLQRRAVEKVARDGATFVPVASLRHRGQDVGAWDEAEECTIDVGQLPLDAILEAAHQHDFVLAASQSAEPVEDDESQTIGRVVRRREEVHGRVRIAAAVVGQCTKLTIEVENCSEVPADHIDRDQALAWSMIGTHTLVGISNGEFVSLLDPPDDASEAVAHCSSDGTFPVLIGDPTAPDTMLSAPIILYDFPEVAPESAGNFCDATEIDEILALRVLTLTDAEKAEARGTDARAAAIVDRCDQMPPEMWSRLHGAVRSLQPIDEASDAAFDPFAASMTISGVEVRNGTRVRLRPSRRADAHDLFYAGRLATVKAVFDDLDGDRHVAVTVDDDPAAELFDWQGRYLFFHPDEIEVVR